MAEYYATRKGSERLFELCAEVEKQLVETAEEMAENARQDADLRENPLFEALRITVTYELPSRRKQLGEQMRGLVIIEEMKEYQEFDGSAVIIGSEVTVNHAGRRMKYRLLGNTEGDIGEGTLSCDAPLARLLIGRTLGEKFEFNGKEIEIISILRI
jgi:transcription elongation factor GreA